MHYVEDVRPTKTPVETMVQTPQQIFDEIFGVENAFCLHAPTSNNKSQERRLPPIFRHQTPLS